MCRMLRVEISGIAGIRPFMQILISLILMMTALRATAATDCRVLTIQASNEGKGVDEKISKFAHIFKNTPFSGYNTFTLIDSQFVKIELKSPLQLQLPDSITGSLMLKKIADGKLDLAFALSRAGKPPVRINGIAAPSSPIFAAGMKSPTGIWIFGVACDYVDNGITY